MATYLILNCLVLGAVWLALWQKPRWPSKLWLISFAAILVLTLLFDNFLIWLGIYSYESSKILGVYIGKAPIEDFMYAVMAVIIVPFIWNKLGERHDG
ncbi:lycopene cyclase domain-containing protein [Candidatus Saccharibacteria bacterium]|nr:lycopene cyclase domain-containing protein [Candidatus Saccharibacteria bacterium]